MSTEPRDGRKQRIHSLGIIDEYTWMLVRQLYLSVSAHLGEPGIQSLEAGFYHYGYYRGETLRNHPKTLTMGRNALSVLRVWDVADFALTDPDLGIDIAGDEQKAIVTLPRLPGSEYCMAHDCIQVLEMYWRATLAGIANGYDEQMSVTLTPISSNPGAPWGLEWLFPDGAKGDSRERLEDPFSNVAQTIMFSRRGFGVLASLGMYVAKSLENKFDATGERVMREALYNFGAERGRQMRAQALKEGRSLGLDTWHAIMGERDPNAAAFVFRGETHITPGVFQLTCTYCPMSEVWAEEGTDGLALGYIYDVEVHRGLLEGFYPGGRVGWEKLKTRGDKVCNFRFYIPELIDVSDPDWAQSVAT